LEFAILRFSSLIVLVFFSEGGRAGLHSVGERAEAVRRKERRERASEAEVVGFGVVGWDGGATEEWRGQLRVNLWFH
jgi:hypothetical protein